MTSYTETPVFSLSAEVPKKSEKVGKLQFRILHNLSFSFNSFNLSVNFLRGLN